MHVTNFMWFCRSSFSDFFHGKTVLDIGAGDIHGNNRSLFTDCEYHGNDVVCAPNVTMVCRTKNLAFPDAYFHTIISTECFEHDPEYQESIRNACRMLEPGGLFAFTCASTHRPEHGTRRTSPSDSFGTMADMADMQDYYKNLTIEDVQECVDLDEVFMAWRSYYHPYFCDLYFWGIKKTRGSEPVDILLPFPYNHHDSTVIETGKNIHEK